MSIDWQVSQHRIYYFVECLCVALCEAEQSIKLASPLLSLFCMIKESKRTERTQTVTPVVGTHQYLVLHSFVHFSFNFERQRKSFTFRLKWRYLQFKLLKSALEYAWLSECKYQDSFPQSGCQSQNGRDAWTLLPIHDVSGVRANDQHCFVDQRLQCQFLCQLQFSTDFWKVSSRATLG